MWQHWHSRNPQFIDALALILVALLQSDPLSADDDFEQATRQLEQDYVAALAQA